VIYRDFERLLATTMPPPRTVQRCAQLLGCSSRTLTRACLSAVGTSPKALVDQALAVEAQRLLSEPGSTATAVASALGFAEPSHFTRFFKRITGETPSTFATTFATATVRSTGEVHRLDTEPARPSGR
jgi:AraC-like DNA-binding protein